MGEMAEYILNGDDCQVCGEYIGEGDGYPRTCAGCGGDEIAPRVGQGRRLRKKRQRQRQAQRRREALLATNDDGWTKHTPYHWSRIHNGHKLDYWPSTGKFMYQGKVEKGNPIELLKEAA